jgi:23S rRNA (uridine2552-2'-O)-methyltransferase
MSQEGGRGGGPSGRKLSVRPKTAKGRKISSTLWLQRQLNDPYVAAAKDKGYRSRAAFKLIEIDDKLHLLKKGQRVVDLGAAPGGWSQVAAQRIKAGEGGGQLVAIDISDVTPINNVTILKQDFLADDAPAKTRAVLGGPVDVVMSDMAASSTGHPDIDHLRILNLVEAALGFAVEVLAPGGSFLSKVLQGGGENALVAEMRKHFTTVRRIKPPSSRADSAEFFLVGTGFKRAV